MAHELDTLLDALGEPQADPDSIGRLRMHREVRARLLDETVAETRIGRFVVGRRLGAGGMGVVWAAHDPDLDRPVAIKLVRGAAVLDRADEQQRLLHEARAIAQLSHPNVVAVYDVGTHGERVYIAMELIEGVTLRAHACSGEWQRIFAAYLQAAAGLAAAHDAGVVHRDFKPDNVLVGRDGRVRVVDFGLAVGDGADPVTLRGADGSGIGPKTIPGRIMGTPAYMAPEQFEGIRADARSDQFSFCVACWEALYGSPPFPGKSIPALLQSIVSGELAPPPKTTAVPPWARAILVRGLAVDPGARWPSMHALLQAAHRGPTRRWPWFAALAAVAGVVGAAIGLGQLSAMRAESTCDDEAAAISEVWHPIEAEAVTSAFVATPAGHAGATADALVRRLDDWTAQWTTSRRASCLAHRRDRTLGGPAFDRRIACLEERRERLVALVEVLRTADRDVVNQAVRAAFELPPVQACDDDDRLAALPMRAEDDPGSLAAASLRRRLLRVQQRTAAGRAEQAEAQAADAVGEASALGDPLLMSEARLRFADALARRGRHAQAADEYERAYFVAAPLGADDVALDAAIGLVLVRGHKLARFDEALMWIRHAEMLALRMGTEAAWYGARIAEHHGGVLQRTGDLKGAEREYRRSIEFASGVIGPEHPRVGSTMVNLGNVLVAREDYGAAEAVLRDAERILIAAHGDDALELAPVFASRCSLAHGRGDYAAALPHCERVAAIREARLGAEHPDVVASLSNLASARATAGDVPGARLLATRVVALRRRLLGAEHPMLALSLSNLAVLDLHLDDLDAAREHLGEALQIQRASLPADHHDILRTQLNLADVHVRAGDHDRSLALFDEVATTTAGGADDGFRGRALAGLGAALMIRGRAHEARVAFEGALRTPHATAGDPLARCELHHDHAVSLRATGGARQDVRAAALRARAACDEADERGTPLHGAIAALLGE